MSGIYIKDMEMPKSFKDIRIYGDGRIVSKSLHTYGEEIATAVPVPPHGDLIDRDEYAYPGDLVDEPVIIPADTAEERET